MFMESSGTKVEALKPVFLKAGIPLALSLAGLIFAKITSRRASSAKDAAKSAEISCTTTTAPDLRNEFRDDDNLVNDSLESTPSIEGEDRNVTSYEQEIMSLRSRINVLQEQEQELETRFLQYQDLKEQESVILKLVNMLLLEMARAEYLDNEVSSMEAANRRVENLMIEYFKLHQQLGDFKRENGFLGTKVKNLRERLGKQSYTLSKKNLRIQTIEAEALRCRQELEKQSEYVEKLKEDIAELQGLVHQLPESKDELMRKLDMSEASDLSIPKDKAEQIPMEDYRKLLDELQQFQKNRAAEAEELIYLKWSNACLRHELMRTQDRRHGQCQDSRSKETIGDSDMHKELVEGIHLQSAEPCSSNENSPAHPHSSKRRHLMRKLKTWVEGSDEKIGRGKMSDGKEHKHGNRCFGRHSVSDWAEEDLASPSCSSA